MNKFEEYDFRTGNHTYKEGQVFEQQDGPGPSSRFVIRNGRKVKLIKCWATQHNYCDHYPFKQAIEGGLLDDSNPMALAEWLSLRRSTFEIKEGLGLCLKKEFQWW